MYIISILPLLRITLTNTCGPADLPGHALAHQALFHQVCHYVQVDLLVSNEWIILLESSVVTNREEYFAVASSKKVTCHEPYLLYYLLIWL